MPASFRNIYQRAIKVTPAGPLKNDETTYVVLGLFNDEEQYLAYARHEFNDFNDILKARHIEPYDKEFPLGSPVVPILDATTSMDPSNHDVTIKIPVMTSCGPDNYIVRAYFMDKAHFDAHESNGFVVLIREVEDYYLSNLCDDGQLWTEDGGKVSTSDNDPGLIDTITTGEVFDMRNVHHEFPKSPATRLSQMISSLQFPTEE